jgi:triphosphatase
MDTGQETELKFTFVPDDLPKIKGLPLLRDALRQASCERLISTYFDTPDNYLWKHGVSLRVRRRGQRLIQTLKQQNASVLDRGEWEGEVSQNLPDTDAIARTPLGTWFRKHHVRECLKANFKVDVERLSTTLDVGLSRIEAAIDEGSAEANGTSAKLSELELELKEGQKRDLFELASVFSRHCPLQLSFISKAEVGYLLAEGAWGRSLKATQPQLASDMSCGEGFEAICRCCLHDFMVNTRALETSDRVEAIHRGRIAIRRLRAALQLFRTVADDDAYPGLVDELKWISDLFGETRDLDVFQEQTFWPVAEDASVVGGKELAEYMETKRNAAHNSLNTAVRSERMRVLLVDLLRWIAEGNWRSRAAAKAPGSIEGFVRAVLKRRRKKLVKQAANLAELGPQSRHKIRIRAKKLRYMAEFFRTMPKIAAKPKALKQFFWSLGELQARLGRIHDEEAKRAFLQEQVQYLPEAAGHTAAFAAGVLAGASCNSGQKLKKSIKAYSELRKANPF